MNTQLVIFVCDGNIERSVVAEQVFRRWLMERGIEGIRVESRGIFGEHGDDPPEFPNLTHYPREFGAARPTLELLGLDLSSQKAQRIESADVERAGVVVAMTRAIYDVLHNRFPGASGKFLFFGDLSHGEDVSDGYGSGDEAFHRNLISQIHETIRDHGGEILERVGGR